MTSKQEKILVVDDDLGLRDLLQRYLSEQGFSVSTVANGQEMDVFFSQHKTDLVILDLMLPGEDGLSIARRKRADSNIPIIILSAKGDDIEKIIGLEMGADDYLAKPFNPRELLARIKAVLRRQANSTIETPSDSNKSISHYSFGSFQLDSHNRKLLQQLDKNSSHEISLTSGEYDLLYFFVTHANRVLSRDQIMDVFNGNDYSPFDRSIDIRITRLRKKIESNSKEPQFIQTIWGMGYLFTPSGKEPSNI